MAALSSPLGRPVILILGLTTKDPRPDFAWMLRRRSAFSPKANSPKYEPLEPVRSAGLSERRATRTVLPSLPRKLARW